MTTARSSQIDLATTPYYHCIVRCAEDRVLYDEDQAGGTFFEDRKHWILERTRFQTTAFAIDVCAYAISRKQFHLLLRVNADDVGQWSDDEVIRRISLVCPGRLRRAEKWTDEERYLLLTTWRARLGSISWFMAKLGEYIARRANREEGRRGKFWKGRFRSRALKQDYELLKSMNWVDLSEGPREANPELEAALTAACR